MTIRNSTALSTLAALALMSSAAMANDTHATSRIDQLPDTGNASITGTVDSVQDKDSFTLRDSIGKTIDVDAKAPLTLAKGDEVKVQGSMKSKMLGMGEKIAGAKVQVIASNTAGTNTGSTYGNVTDNSNRNGNSASTANDTGSSNAISNSTSGSSY